jgi:hypothetical protein
VEGVERIHKSFAASLPPAELDLFLDSLMLANGQFSRLKTPALNTVQVNESAC